MTTIYASGFEDHTLSSWSGLDAATGCTTDVVSNIKNSGTYSMHMYLPSTISDAWGGVYKTFTASNTVYVRFYKMWHNLPTNNDDRDRFIAIEGNGNWDTWVTYMKNGDNLQFILSYYSGSSATPYNYDIIADTQYCVELAHIKGVSGSDKFWLNGTLVLDSGTIDSSTINTPDKAHILSNNFYGNGWTNESWIDDVVISDSYIGTIASSTMFTITSVTVNPYLVIRTGTNYSTIVVNFTDTATLPTSSYTVDVYLRNTNTLDPYTVGPYTATVGSVGVGSYSATLALDPSTERIVTYDLKAVVSKAG